jgi:hypothetical protein
LDFLFNWSRVLDYCKSPACDHIFHVRRQSWRIKESVMKMVKWRSRNLFTWCMIMVSVKANIYVSFQAEIEDFLSAGTYYIDFIWLSSLWYLAVKGISISTFIQLMCSTRVPLLSILSVMYTDFKESKRRERFWS